MTHSVDGELVSYAFFSLGENDKKLEGGRKNIERCPLMDYLGRGRFTQGGMMAELCRSLCAYEDLSAIDGN